VFLEHYRSALAGWLAQARGLLINPKPQEVVLGHSPGIFLGYRISRSGLSPDRKLRRRMARRLRLAARRGDQALMRSIHSYRGILCFPDR